VVDAVSAAVMTDHFFGHRVLYLRPDLVESEHAVASWFMSSHRLLTSRPTISPIKNSNITSTQKLPSYTLVPFLMSPFCRHRSWINISLAALATRPARLKQHATILGPLVQSLAALAYPDEHQWLVRVFDSVHFVCGHDSNSRSSGRVDAPV
jgi:hypothetical protein